MRRVALAFAGQGAEAPRMGVALAEAFAPARALLDAAGADVVDALARGRALTRTADLQPALVAVGLGASEALRAAGVAPAVVLGHSLGELAAWSASGAIAPADAVRLARARGEAMEEAARARPGGMLALSSSSLALVGAASKRPRGGELSIAAHNAAGREWALAGDAAALRAAEAQAGGRRLPVAGPWHAPSMAGAAGAFTRALSALEPAPPCAVLVANATGEPAAPRDVARLLVRQLTRPVRWARSMRTLARLGVTDLVVCGPGKALRLFARGAPFATHACEAPDDVARLARELAA
ncbi:MAG: ACP S-malonyltransferase [Sandaracinaceae bacterium]|nr:ACP S-malonyltransferase [Sandaracinaceae bacterium]